MKKLLLLSTLLIFACSSDSEGSESDIDPIIGEWRIYYATNNDNPDSVGLLNMGMTMTFYENGEFKLSNDPLSNWQNLGGNDYQIDFGNQINDFDQFWDAKAYLHCENIILEWISTDDDVIPNTKLYFYRTEPSYDYDWENCIDEVEYDY